MEIYYELIKKTRINKEQTQEEFNERILTLLDQSFRVLQQQEEEIKKLKKDFKDHDHLNGRMVRYY